MTTVADCQHCGLTFEVPNTLAGGIANCPDCGKATPVGGLRDPLWRLWQLSIPVIAAAVGYVVAHLPYMNATVGWIAGVMVAAALWLISRAF